jgi:hypothetical protein
MLRAVTSQAVSGGGIGLTSVGVMAQSAVPASVTGTTAQTTLATIQIPAGAVGINGSLRITTLWSIPNNANTKRVRVTLAGTAFLDNSLGAAAGMQAMTIIRNRGVINSQVSLSSVAGSSFSSTTGVSTTAAIDMSQAQSLIITGTLAVITDTITLEGYTVEILNP